MDHDRHGFGAVGVVIADIAAAVAHQDVFPVGGHAPSFFVGKSKFPYFFKGFGVIYETNFCGIGELVDLVVEEKNPFSEIFLAIELGFRRYAAGVEVDRSEQGTAAIGHVDRLGARAFIELTVMEQKTLGIRAGIVRVGFNNRIADRWWSIIAVFGGLGIGFRVAGYEHPGGEEKKGQFVHSKQK